MNWALYGVAAYITYGCLLVIAKVGKPREPIDHASAVLSVVLGAAAIVVITLAGLRMT